MTATTGFNSWSYKESEEMRLLPNAAANAGIAFRLQSKALGPAWLLTFDDLTSVKIQTITVFSVGCITAALAGYWLGHSRAEYRWPSDGSPHPVGLTLGKVLNERGVGPDAVTHFRFVGDENSSTRGLVAVDTNVAWIWGTMIATAEPYTFWLPSGYRRVEMFTQGSQQPAAVLFVNETDATHLEGESRRFMCHGLHSVAMNLLREAQEQEKP